MSQTKKSSRAAKVSKAAEKKAKASRVRPSAAKVEATDRRSDRPSLKNTKTLTIRLCPKTREVVRAKLALSGLSISAGLRMVMAALASGAVKLPAGLPRAAGGSLLEDRVTVLVNRDDLHAATEATGMSDGEVGRMLLIAIANETIVLHSPRASFVEAAAA